METTFTAVDIIYDVLDASTELKNLISGNLYKFDSRPPKPGTEDIVVNAITMADGIIQPGTCNVNIHVPDKKQPGEEAVYDVPNVDRLAMITEKVKEVLGGDKGKVQTKSTFWISSLSGTFKEPEMKEHYVNLRIELEFHNQTYLKN